MTRLAAPLVLASASPRRREILLTLGVPFEVRPVEVDEACQAGEEAQSYVDRVAALKALAVAETVAGDPRRPFVLAADTAVVADGAVLGKPGDEADALGMLRRLVGRAHQVMTAVALARAGEGLLAREVVVSHVVFRRVDEATLRRYAASGEGRDKAGGYAVQGLGAGLVSEVRGSYHAVVGLPAAQTLALLERAGALSEWP